MMYKSLNDFIDACRQLGQVVEVHGAELDLEVGCLTELAYEQDGPVLLFDQFKGLPSDFRVVSNVFRNIIRRWELALGFSPDAHPMELVKSLRERRREQKMIPPVEVKDGPILEHVIKDPDVNVEMFPAPKWHSGDGGRYIGTGDIVILRDPETGWVNFGTYRACVQGRDRISFWINKHKRGRIIAEKYWSRGQSCPIAVVLGCDPLTFMASTSRQKYEYAGAMHGAPVITFSKGIFQGIPPHHEFMGASFTRLEGFRRIPPPGAIKKFPAQYVPIPG